jgi:5'-deoxynucleotidase
MALFHDATEVFTGDIPTPVKHHNPKMLANFRELEAMAAERLLGMVPPALKAAYAPLVSGTAAPLAGAAPAAPAGASGTARGDAPAAVPGAAASVPAPEPSSATEPGTASGISLDADAPSIEEADRELMKMLKAADLLDAYIKCLSELSSGNREFAVAKGQTEQALALLKMPEIDWFLAHMAPSFSKTLDELSEEE